MILLKKRELKNLIFNKSNLIILILILAIFISMFISIKNEFFYNAINYIHNYLEYYVLKYLDGDASKLIVSGSPLLYIEGDYVNIFSSIYLYVVSFGTLIFKIFIYIFPILVFYIINRTLHDEFHNNFAISKIVRIGQKKYYNIILFFYFIYTSLILIIPKILYFIGLNIFFPFGVSSLHYINEASFIAQPYLYAEYIYNPIVMLVLDLILSIAYCSILTFISVNVIAFFKNKAISNLMFVFGLCLFSVLAIFIGQAPIVSYISLWSALELSNNFSFEMNIFIPIIISYLICGVLFVITKIVLNRKIKDFV